MKKFTKLLLTSLVFIICFSSYSYAGSKKVVDGQNLLTDTQEQELTKRIEDIISKYNTDVVIVNMPVTRMYIGDYSEYTDLFDDYSSENNFSAYAEYDPPATDANGKTYKTPEEFSDDFFDYNNYGIAKNGSKSDDDKSGLLYFVSMDLRWYHLSTKGEAVEIFDDNAIDDMGGAVVKNLGKDKSNSYYISCKQVLDDIEYILEKHASGKTYSTDYRISRFKPNIIVLIVLFGIALLSGYIVVEGYKSDMNTNLGSTVASDYIMKNSFKLTTKNDTFVSTNTAKVRIPTDSGTRSGGGGGHYSSTHVSSSGSHHGGGGGRF